MRYIDTERQLANIFTKPFDDSRFADLQGEIVFAIHIAWFEGGWCFILYIVYLAFLLHFLHTHLSHLASPAILAYIYLIMLITVLG
jgi:hypothetical protein